MSKKSITEIALNRLKNRLINVAVNKAVKVGMEVAKKQKKEQPNQPAKNKKVDSYHIKNFEKFYQFLSQISVKLFMTNTFDVIIEENRVIIKTKNGEFAQDFNTMKHNYENFLKGK